MTQNLFTGSFLVQNGWGGGGILAAVDEDVKI